jgi:hypothetical protein
MQAREGLRPADVLAAQQTVGNDVVQRSLDNTIQRIGEEFEPLGGGSMNEVYRVKHMMGGRGYFKPNTAEDPQMGAKAVMSSDINKVLKLDALAKETYQRYKINKNGAKTSMEGAESEEVPGTTSHELEFNTPIDEATYKDSEPANVKSKVINGETKYFEYSGAKHKRHDYSNPQTQKDLSNLQLQDAITGQYDRHGANIRIDDQTGRAKGYDSDLVDFIRPTAANALSRLPHLRKPANGKEMSAEEKAIQKKSRIAAISQVNRPSDKNLGLPTHLDVASAQTLASTNSTAFLQSLKKQNKANYERFDKAQMEELRNRYSAVRRYAKAGLAASHPELIQDPAKRAKWSSPEYRQMVEQGAGALPKIVNEWDAKSYNEQMNAAPKPGATASGYAQRAVLAYNKAASGQEPRHSAEGSDVHGPLPTTLWTPSAEPVRPTNQRHGRILRPTDLSNPMLIGQRAQRIPRTGLPTPADTGTVANPPVNTTSNPSSTTDEEELMLQADSRGKRQGVTTANGELIPELNQAIQRKRGGGTSLPEEVRRDARRILGQDFKDVRIHTDSEAHHLSRSISARAFTIGKDIFFKEGVFAPGTRAGRETILHELTHVVQQSRSGRTPGGALKLGAPDTAHEKEADQVGKKHAAVPTAVLPSVQRSVEEEEIQAQGEEDELMMQPAEEEEIQMQGDDDDWETDPEPVKQTRSEPVSREKMSELSQLMVGQMQAGEISHGLVKPNIPEAPPPPLPKRPRVAQKGGFSSEIAQKAKAMSGPKQRRNLEKLESARSEKVGTRLSQQYKEDQAKKPKSVGQRLKAGLGQAGKFGASLLKSSLKSQVGDISKQFTGVNLLEKYGDFKEKQSAKAKEKEAEQAKASPGGGGGGGASEMIAELYQENKRLKAQLAEFENAKA